MSFNKSKSKSSSKPLSAKERSTLFSSSLANIGNVFKPAGSTFTKRNIVGYEPGTSGTPGIVDPTYGYTGAGAPLLDAMGGVDQWGREVNAPTYGGTGRTPIYETGTGTYDTGKMQFGDTLMNVPEFDRRDFAGGGEARTLSGGDYDALQESLYGSATSGLSRFEEGERERIDQDLGDRGIYSSGAAVQAQGDLTESLGDVYGRAGTDAATQRYLMQLQEQQTLNQRDLQAAQMENVYGLQAAEQDYGAQWAPLDYLAGLWGQTGGTKSSGGSSGFGASI